MRIETNKLATPNQMTWIKDVVELAALPITGVGFIATGIVTSRCSLHVGAARCHRGSVPLSVVGRRVSVVPQFAPISRPIERSAQSNLEEG